jgi:hypothetical protein
LTAAERGIRIVGDESANEKPRMQANHAQGHDLSRRASTCSVDRETAVCFGGAGVGRKGAPRAVLPVTAGESFTFGEPLLRAVSDRPQVSTAKFGMGDAGLPRRIEPKRRRPASLPPTGSPQRLHGVAFWQRK